MAILDQFHYQLLGNPSGPKLVFLHGLMGSAANWRKITNLFADAYHILIYDQRGHGRSFQPASGYRPEDYADDLAKILDELAWEKVLLVGHSMGGRNALNFASRWPHRVIGLCLEDISAEGDQEGVNRIENLLALVPTPFASRIEAKHYLLEEFPRKLKQKDAMTLAQYFYSNMADQTDGTTDWRFSKSGVLASLYEGRTRDRWDELKKLSMPTLLVRGQESPDLRADVYERMLAANPMIQGAEIGPSGHWVHFDQPEKFAVVLRKFFDSLKSS